MASFIILVTHGLAAWWVYKDAVARNDDHPGRWAVYVFLFLIIALPIYFFKRPPKVESLVCSNCGECIENCLEQNVKFCPTCGTPFELDAPDSSGKRFFHKKTEKAIPYKKYLVGALALLYVLAIFGFLPGGRKKEPPKQAVVQTETSAVKFEQPQQKAASTEAKAPKPKQESTKQAVSTAKPEKQSPNYKYILKQDLPRITGQTCTIDMPTLEMNRMGDDYVIFHCTALVGGVASRVEALYYSDNGKLIQMKLGDEVIYHDTAHE